MSVIPNPKTGDDFIDLLIVTGVSSEVIQLMAADTQRYVRSLTREEIRKYQKIYRRAKKLFCSY